MRVLPDPYVLAFLLADALALLLCYNRLLSALKGSAACFHSFHSTQEMLGNNYVCASVRIIFFLLQPFYALTLCMTGLSSLDFAWTLVALLGLVLLRKLVRPQAFLYIMIGFFLVANILVESWLRHGGRKAFEAL